MADRGRSQRSPRTSTCCFVACCSNSIAGGFVVLTNTGAYLVCAPPTRAREQPGRGAAVPLRAAVSRDRVLLASGTHQQATPRPRGVPRRLPGAQRATSGTLAVFFAVAPSAARVAVKQTASARFKAYGSGGGTNLDAMAAPTRTIEARGRGGSVGWALRTGRPRPYWAVRSPGNARARQIGQRTASTHAVHTVHTFIGVVL